MAFRQNVATRNALANAFAALFASGTLEIRTGAQPADPASAATGTLLASIALPASPFGAASAGAVAKSGTWSDTNADATGTAGYARFIGAGGETFDVSISTSGGGGDLIIDNASVVAGGTVTVTSFTYTVPSGV